MTLSIHNAKFPHLSEIVNPNSDRCGNLAYAIKTRRVRKVKRNISATLDRTFLSSFFPNHDKVARLREDPVKVWMKCPRDN
jgi:hypothetical protein